MSKEIKLITYYSGPSTDDQIASSWKAQISDLRLFDATDIYGKLKFEHAIYTQCQFKLEKPYIYKLSKGIQSFTLMGTCHVLKEDVFPPNLKELIFRHKKLVMECVVSQSDEEKNNEINDVISSDVHQMGSPNELGEEVNGMLWFEDLPYEVQRFIHYILYEAAKSETKVASFLGLSSPHTILSIVYQLHFDRVTGMDESISQEFEESGKEIFSLESFEENQNDIYLCDLKTLTEEMIEDVKELMRKGGVLANPACVELGKSYLSGTFQDEEEDKLCEVRTANWYEKRLPDLLDQYPNGELLVMVGASHVIGNNGLLDLYGKDGWFIEQADCSGEFHPLEGAIM